MKASRIKLFLAMVVSVMAVLQNASAKSVQDTVVIELENGSKILIYTTSKANLKSIEQYDINQMIRDLNLSISKGDQSYLEITDSGDRYIKDTTVVYQKSEKSSMSISGIELKENKNWDKLSSRDDDNDYKVYKSARKPSKRTRNDFNIDLGTNNWLEDGNKFPNELNRPYAVKPWGSWYVGLNSVNQTYIGGPLNLDWGFGVSWYNWKMEDPNFVAVQSDTQTDFLPVAAGINPSKSKLTAAYLNFTMVPMLHFGDGIRRSRKYGNSTFYRSKSDSFRIGAGGYTGYRLASHSKLVYNQSGKDDVDKFRDNFYLNNIRYGIRIQAGWKGVDLFANYDLNEVFVAGKGPKLNAVSFGVIL